jgi:hypothetical protein
MRTTKILQFMLVLCIPMWFAVASYGAGAPELQENAIGETPPRLSFTYDNVSFWRPGSEEWSQAQVNTPLAPGDQLYTGPRGDLEVQTGSRAFVRAGPNSQLGLANHEPGFLQFNVTAGNTSFDLRGLDPGQTVEVDTPSSRSSMWATTAWMFRVSAPRSPPADPARRPSLLPPARPWPCSRARKWLSRVRRLRRSPHTRRLGVMHGTSGITPAQIISWMH